MQLSHFSPLVPPVGNTPFSVLNGGRKSNLLQETDSGKSIPAPEREIFLLKPSGRFLVFLWVCGIPPVITKVCGILPWSFSYYDLSQDLPCYEGYLSYLLTFNLGRYF